MYCCLLAPLLLAPPRSRNESYGVPVLLDAVVNEDAPLDQLVLNLVGVIEVLCKLCLQSLGKELVNLVLPQLGAVRPAVPAELVVVPVRAEVGLRLPRRAAAPSGPRASPRAGARAPTAVVPGRTRLAFGVGVP